jgi:hypothetical protein
MYKLKGSVIHIGETQQITETFKKRDLVIFVDGQYPQEYIFEATQTRCELLDAVQLKQEVEVGFAIQGNGWTSKEGEKRWANTLVLLQVYAV